MNRRHGAVLAVMVLLGACGSDAKTASTPAATEPVTSVATTAASTTAAPSSTVATTTPTPTPTPSETTGAPITTAPAPALTVGDLPTSGPCALGEPPEGGEVTFVVGSRLYGIGSTDAVECLADLQGRTPTWISWSPDGDEVLVGPDTLLRADGTFTSTGYFADNTNVRWSAPTGKALIAPKATTGQLIWRNAHDNAQRIDVSFADEIAAAAYHPAGKHIAAVGVGRDGLGPGLFVATNRGGNPQRFGQIETDGTFTDVAFDMSGDSLVFVHQHADGSSELHRYHFLTGALDPLAEMPDVTPTDLTVSPVDEGDMAWTQTYSTVNSRAYVLVNGATSAVTIAPLAEQLTEPVGWLPGHMLLVKSQSPASAVGSPFSLWEWTPTGMTYVIDGVTAAATRTVHGPYNELTLIPGSGFG